VGKEMGVGEKVPLLKVDATDNVSLRKMVDSTKVVLTTVGNVPCYHYSLLNAEVNLCITML
jgi:hypothetical protein